MLARTLDAPTLVEASSSEILDDILVRICNRMQLSSTQFSLAERRYHAICNWLGATESLLNPYRPELYPQGSVALGTTVKPLKGEEYDVDLVCELAISYQLVSRPVVLLDMLERRMAESEIYRPRLERKKRCLRLNYENDFHLDILPACPDPASGATCLVIPDREDKNWQASNPKGFVKWFSQKGALRLLQGRSQKAMDAAAPLPQPQSADQMNTLQICVQLIKRWRDLYYASNADLAPVSVVLTTLMGDHYFGEQSVSSNLAASVQAIIRSLPEVGRLTVTNPSHPQEELSERWEDERAYVAFVRGMAHFRKQITELNACEDMGRRSQLLQMMFGEDLVKTAFGDQARTIEEFRNAQKIRIGKSASGVVSLSATVGTSIPRNTFYGEAER